MMLQSEAVKQFLVLYWDDLTPEHIIYLGQVRDSCVVMEERLAHLEHTLMLEEAWDEDEHTFFADFVVRLNEHLIKLLREKANMTLEEINKTLFGKEEVTYGWAFPDIPDESDD